MDTAAEPLPPLPLAVALTRSGLKEEFIRRAKLGIESKVLLAWCKAQPVLANAYWPTSGLRSLRKAWGCPGRTGGNRGCKNVKRVLMVPRKPGTGSGTGRRKS